MVPEHLVSILTQDRLEVCFAINLPLANEVNCLHLDVILLG